MKATKLILAASLAAGMGCSTSNTATTHAPSATVGGELAMTTSVVVAEREAPETELPSFDAAQLAGLPQAPWSETQLSLASAPTLATAWASAENRGWCAPLTPQVAAGARATQLDGGWMVEFDEAGAPGVTEDGEPCESCGRGTFGIAGTAMGVDEMMEAPSPSFADGSAADITTEEGVASATLAVPGQRCVYQVWSFRGEAHLQELLGTMRFVATPRASDTQMADLVPTDFE
jgi:hypothetical protein